MRISYFQRKWAMIEPTKPGQYYHYDTLNNIPTPPPPPPAEYYMQQKTGKLWKISIPVVLILFGLILGVLIYPVINTSYHSPATEKPTVFVPFGLPPTKAAITVKPSAYDARAIVSNLQQAGLQAANIQYGVPACSNKIVGLQSEACFNNASLCNLQCDEDSVWVKVFDTTQNAQLDYQQWVQSDGPVPSTIFTGHCVVVGNL